MDNELSKGFTEIEINGVRFSNIREMLIYMDKQRRRIIDLEKENKVLAQNLEDTEIINKAYEKRFNDLEKENAELKSDNDARKFAMVMSEKVEKQLREEIAELKTRNQELLESCEGATMMYRDLQKAKELIKTLLLIADNKVSQMEFQLCVADAKQFLNSEVEK